MTRRSVSLNVSQSWGSTTWASRSQASGSLRCNHDSLVIVKLATGTSPQASAQACRPPGNWSISHAASGADSVSFHSFAGRMT